MEGSFYTIHLAICGIDIPCRKSKKKKSLIRTMHKWSVCYQYCLSSTQACFEGAGFPSIQLCLWSWASGIVHWWERLCSPDSLEKPLLMNQTHTRDCHLKPKLTSKITNEMHYTKTIYKDWKNSLIQSLLFVKLNKIYGLLLLLYCL